jgi:hypothetical protein
MWDVLTAAPDNCKVGYEGVFDIAVDQQPIALRWYPVTAMAY